MFRVPFPTMIFLRRFKAFPFAGCLPMAFHSFKQTTAVAVILSFLFFNACLAGPSENGGKGHVCAVCGKAIDGQWVLADGQQYHTTCFKEKIELRCTVCGKPINGVYAKDNQGVYHESCFKNTRLERCVICNQPIEGDHLVDSWGQSSHHSHQGKQVMLCDSCGRIISPASKSGFRYKDGRVICGICNATAVTHVKIIKPILVELSKMLSSVGIGPVSPQIPVTLVDRMTLIRESRGNDKENTRGFTKSIIRIENGKTLSFQHRIFILHGLPMTEFKGVLAHEMIHVWLNENRMKMSAQETEGFCNLGIFLVNEKERSDFARVLQDQMEQNGDAIYGEGYRIMKFRLDSMGWPRLIAWVKNKSK